jgi:hypothetical protein
LSWCVRLQDVDERSIGHVLHCGSRNVRDRG